LVKFEKTVIPGDIYTLNLMVYLPEKINKDKIILLFQFESEGKHRFGDYMVGIIDIGLEGDL